MDRVTSFSSYSTVLANLMRAESRQADAQAQVSSTKIGDDLAAFGGGASSLNAAQSLKTRTDGFVASTKVLENRLAVQDLALNQVGDAAQGARDAIAHAVATGSGTGLMDTLQNMFGNAVQGLNASDNGNYLFAGGQSSTQPVAARNLADLTASAAAPPISNGSLERVDQLDDATTVKTGFLARDVGQKLFDAFKQVQAFQEGATGSFGAQLTPEQTDFLTGVLASFDAATAGITQVTAQNGLVQSQAEASRTAQEDRQTTLEGLVGDLSGVDMAEAATRLAQAQTAVQASAQVWATLKDVSLLNYLN